MILFHVNGRERGPHIYLCMEWNGEINARVGVNIHAVGSRS